MRSAYATLASNPHSGIAAMMRIWTEYARMVMHIPYTYMLIHTQTEVLPWSEYWQMQCAMHMQRILGLRSPDARMLACSEYFQICAAASGSTRHCRSTRKTGREETRGERGRVGSHIIVVGAEHGVREGRNLGARCRYMPRGTPPPSTVSLRQAFLFKELAMKDRTVF
jgi:hypothetical protein